MIHRIIEQRISAAERVLGVPADYMRYILHTSLRCFFKFLKIVNVSEYRRALPAEAYHVGRLVATRAEDCGTCVQIAVNLAKRDHIPLEIIKAVLDSSPDNLPPDLADVYRFTEEVVNQTGDGSSLRDRLRRRLGETAFVELAMAIAVCRVFPATKRALGYAKSCAAVRVHL